MTCAVLAIDKFRTHQAETEDTAMELFRAEHPELVLLDMDMDETSGASLLKKIKAENQFVSVLLVSERSKTIDIIEGLDAGADDYIIKPFDPGELLARVRTQVRIQSLTKQLKIANEKLEILVETDDLTGLLNMRSIYERLDSELSRAKRHQRYVIAIMMDLDHFKKVNDENDHLFGSWVLKQIGLIISHAMRAGDFAARYGGDEFLVVITETDKLGAEAFCKRLGDAIRSRHFEYEGNHVDLTASMGYSISDFGQRTDARALVRAADRALYEAKRSGRDRVCFVALESHEEVKAIAKVDTKADKA